MPRPYGFSFSIPNLPKHLYEYLREVRDAQGLSPWQVIVLALLALEYVSKSDPHKALDLVERVKVEHPKP